MRLTFATNGNGIGEEILRECNAPNILVAFPYKRGAELLGYDPEYFITDSGAFTAWNIGKSVDIDAYAEWATYAQKKFSRVVSVNLDVIPGEKGRNSTAEERKNGMKKSLQNADYLRSKGLNVMEVFHQDEPREFLDELLSRLPEDGVLGLSPRNDVSMPKKLEWHKTLLSYFASKYPLDKMPRCHGLAVTSPSLLEAFPYYSGDSSSWVSALRFGTAIDEWGKATKSHVPDGSQITLKHSREFMKNAIRQSVLNQMRVSDSITAMWERRGIHWEN